MTDFDLHFAYTTLQVGKVKISIFVLELFDSNCPSALIYTSPYIIHLFEGTIPKSALLIVFPTIYPLH